MSGKPVKSLTRPDVGKPSIPRDTSMADLAENEGSSSEDEYPPRASQGDGSQNMSSQRSNVSGLSADGSQRMDSQDMELPSVAASAEPTTEPMIIAIENQLLEPIGEHADESDDASTATGLSVKSTDTINSLADSVVSFANSLASASESSFTMAPSADALLADFYEFWNQHRDIGYTAVMVAFISFAYSNSGINRDAITDFFTKMNPGLNLRAGEADIRPIAEVIKNAVTQPGRAAGGSGIMSGITNGIRAFATAVATIIGTNLVVPEPLTIDNVTTLLSEVGTTMVEVSGTVPDFVSRFTVKVAELKALHKIRNMERGAIDESEAARIQQAIDAAAHLLNVASAADRRRDPLPVGDIRTQVNAIITNLKSGAGVGATAPSPGAGGPGKGGKRQSQKKQRQQQKKQKKTQKQSHKKLSKSKRAKKAKQSKKANKKH
jgi:hypothetical protein